MTDQIMHLREAGIPCEMLSSELDKQDHNEIHRRIKFLSPDTPEHMRIRLLFVTPERIVNKKTLLSVLQEADSNGMLCESASP